MGKCLNVDPLGIDEFVIIMEQDASEQCSEVMSVQDLVSLPLIIFEPGSGTRALIDDWFRCSGHVPSPVMELGSIEAIKKMVSAGLGYSIVPRISVATQEDQQGLSLYPMTPLCTGVLAS